MLLAGCDLRGRECRFVPAASKKSAARNKGRARPSCCQGNIRRGRGTPFANLPGMTTTIRKILLPTDFGPSCTGAAAYAGALARGLNASVHLVHVLEEPLIRRDGWHSQAPATQDQLYHECRAKLAALAATLQHPADRITIEVRTGRPAEAIVDAAVDYGVDPRENASCLAKEEPCTP